MCKWLPPYGFTCTVHHVDARVGGTHKASFTNFTTGKSHSFGGTYVDAEVVVSGGIVTARTWHDNPAWMREFVKLLPGV